MVSTNDAALLGPIPIAMDNPLGKWNVTRGKQICKWGIEENGRRGRMREDYGPDCSDSHEREAAFHQYRLKSNQPTMYMERTLVGQTLGRASGRDRTRPRDFTKTCCRIVRGLISKKVEPLLLSVALSLSRFPLKISGFSLLNPFPAQTPRHKHFKG